MHATIAEGAGVSCRHELVMRDYVRTEAEEPQLLGSITRQRLVKI
jgi:hypothetical protein